MKTGGIDNTLTSALQGLQVGINNAATAAGDVGRLTTGSKDVQDAVRPLLKLQEAENQTAASTQVVKAQDESLGRLIDETA